MNTSSKELGDKAEQRACEYLEQHGLTLRKRNFHSKAGEIDLIMRDQDYLVFVEVRMRHNPDHASCLESVTPNKQSKIKTTALYYLQQEKLLDKVDCRFDVVGIDQQEKIIWIKNAFEVQY